MHVVFVSRLFGSGGVAVYHRTLARELVEGGHRASILTSRRTESEPALEEMAGVKIHRLLVRGASRFYRLPILRRYARSSGQLLYSYRVANRLQELENSDHPDVIEFAEIEGEAFAYLLRRERRPVVVRCHTPTFVLRRYHRPQEMPFDTRLTEAMEKYCIRHAEALTAPSKDMARTVALDCGVPVDNIRPIPNALDVGAFAAGRGDRPPEKASASFSLPGGRVQDEPLILHVGRLERVKGIGVLAEAIPQVLARAPQARFVFIGGARSDESARDWKQRLEKAGRGRVTFLGFVEQEKMQAWYQRADIAVVPSLNYESFSYTCAQAMAAGLPVVASRIGGIPETVDEGLSGLLVKPGDVGELARALVRLAEDPDLRGRMGRHGQRKARERFAAPQVASQMLDLYSGLMGY